jgi:hypothetical protein
MKATEFDSNDSNVPAVLANNTGLTGGDAVFGVSALGRGIVGVSTKGTGVEGNSTDGAGVAGINNSTTGGAAGVFGQSSNREGVYGVSIRRPPPVWRALTIARQGAGQVCMETALDPTA